MHYIEVLLEDSSEESELELNEGKDDSLLLRAEGMLGSMVASLHGVKKCLTLKLIGQACGQDVMVMIDPGALHNFIDIHFAESKDLKTKGFEGFRVSNANGKLTLVDWVVERLGVKLQGCVVRENFYLYTLMGHPHIILGVQWLFELGDIHTNYQNLTMRFEMDGVEHTLQGLQEEDAQRTNNRLEVVQMTWGDTRTITWRRQRGGMGMRSPHLESREVGTLRLTGQLKGLHWVAKEPEAPQKERGHLG